VTITSKNITIKKAVSILSKRLKFRSDKQLRDNLEFAADDLAHAYKIGAEEAQGELISRIRQMEKS
jgi:hypothetical protein